jgi:hypothetical protein
LLARSRSKNGVASLARSRSKNGVASLARSRSKNGVASLAYGPGHPRLAAKEDVDGRVKPDHDERRGPQFNNSSLLAPM